MSNQRPPHFFFSFFHVIDGWRLVSDIQNSVVVRLDCDTGWVHSSGPWVLHSRRSWQERRGKVVGGWIWSDQIFRHLFFFTDWLAVKVIMIITQGQVRYKGQQSTLYLSFFFFLLSRMAKVRSLIISPMLSSHLVQSVYFFASPFNHCRDWERSFTVHVLHTNTRSKFFISVLFLLFLFFFPFCRADFSALSSSQVFQSSSEHLKWSPVSSQHL